MTARPPTSDIIGARISLNSYVGTVRFLGQVDNTTGSWIGVEWDDPTRGKHDGCLNGKRYFSCRSKSAGSFIRPTSNIQYGVSFLDALTSKYIEHLHGSQTLETVVLGSSGGAIQVEAVSLDKIRQKFARLDQLREVSLDSANVAHADSPGHILQTCPNIRGLDLSKNLFQTWLPISEIVKELRFLRRLSLNRNRLPAPSSSAILPGAFEKLEELHLNDTMLTWRDMQIITIAMPCLKSVELGYNHLRNLSTEVSPAIPPHPTLQSLNLDSNSLSDWFHVSSSLNVYKRYFVRFNIISPDSAYPMGLRSISLQHLVLASNVIETIPFPNQQQQIRSLSSIQYLSLSENRIASWSSLDALSIWMPNLKSLSIRGNPLVNDNDNRQARSFIIARISSLVTLDGTRISSRERTDSELYYLSFIIQQGDRSEGERREEHRRWADLCDTYGRPTELQNQILCHDKLSNRLIDLELYPYPESKQGDVLDVSKRIRLQVLPSLSLKILRTKICKTLKHDIRRTKVTCWMRMKDNALLELENKDDSKDLDWLGLESGSQIVYQASLHVP